MKPYEHMVKELVSFIIRWSGIPSLLRNTFGRRGVTVVVYHDPLPEAFERHIRYLKERYTTILLDTLVEAIRSGRWSAIPRKALVITFDDGHKGNYRLLPLFERHCVLPTIFLCSGVAGTQRHFWFREKELRPEILKECADTHRLRILRDRFGFFPTRLYPDEERQALSIDEIRSMGGHVDFQSHSCFHPILPRCEPEDCREEIFASKREIEKLSRRECRHFAYPNGDYTEREIDHLRRAGYSSARTVFFGWNVKKTDPFRLRAVIVTDNGSVNLLAAQLSGIPYYLREIMRRIKALPGGMMRNGRSAILPKTP